MAFCQVVKTKQLINLLCEHSGKPKIYQDADLDSGTQSASVASDEFYGRPLGTSLRSILEKRKLAGNGPATPRELYDILIEGGYQFDTEVEQNRLTSVRISLRKSSRVFHRLPDKKRYGLLEWYPAAKKQGAKDDDIDTGGELEDSNGEEEKATPDQE